MPPARRRGANKANANGDFRLGDLVLAKVKGFPAWPAKVRYSQFQFFGLFTISFIILLGCEFMILQF
ncbi:ENHANCER OF AG-4 protein [Trifolium repens]|nr:ENHANCER OF AG-4 protein [Trifolium repens]